MRTLRGSASTLFFCLGRLLRSACTGKSQGLLLMIVVRFGIWYSILCVKARGYATLFYDKMYPTLLRVFQQYHINTCISKESEPYDTKRQG